MSMQSKSASFGQKGADDKPVTLAQSLLTGKPLSRARVQDRIPKLKPRVKARFGRKEECSLEDGASPAAHPQQIRRRWTFWLTMVAALVAGV